MVIRSCNCSAAQSNSLRSQSSGSNSWLSVIYPVKISSPIDSKPQTSTIASALWVTFSTDWFAATVLMPSSSSEGAYPTAMYPQALPRHPQLPLPFMHRHYLLRLWLERHHVPESVIKSLALGIRHIAKFSIHGTFSCCQGCRSPYRVTIQPERPLHSLSSIKIQGIGMDVSTSVA